MEITKAVFVVSNSDVKKCPSEQRHEYAFIGRSNVGKSSLINMLTGVSNLAKTSATPGKTLLINHFLINDEWFLVDLPGYGYAQRSRESREEIYRIIQQYIAEREQLTSLFVLVDIRIKPQKIDLEFINWLGENGVPFSIIFTKADKISKTAAARAMEDYRRELLKTWEEVPQFFCTSSAKGTGKEEILDYIENINKNLLQAES
ncbi:MAG: ribosome biogenesis GTP-binding protein YihA/YsxC [Muribaculaceae bacterium]